MAPVLSSEDEMLSRDFDLSSYTHLDAAEDSRSGHHPRRGDERWKRKFTENRILFASVVNRGSSTGTAAGAAGGDELGSHCDSPSIESLNHNSRKRLTLVPVRRRPFNVSMTWPVPMFPVLTTFSLLQLTTATAKHSQAILVPKTVYGFRTRE